MFYFNGGHGMVWDISEIQVEEKRYSTSFVLDRRTQEDLYIPNPMQYLDSERGSIELEFEPLVAKGSSTTQSYRFHDLTTYDSSSGFIIGREGDNFHFYTHNGTTLYNSNPAIPVYNLGDTLTYRVEWNKSTNQTKFYVDGILLATLPMFKITDLNMYIGCRSEAGAGRGNAIYKSLIMRNRNGETVFKL
jgi:hypothetical protein